MGWYVERFIDEEQNVSDRKYMIVLDAMVLELRERLIYAQQKWEQASEQNLPTLKAFADQIEKISAQIDVLSAFKLRLQVMEK